MYADPTDDTTTTMSPTAPTFDQVNADYLKWLGRPLTQSEYDANWAHAYNYNAGMIANSPEGLARTNQNVPGTGSYDPKVPLAPGNWTGQGGTDTGGGGGGTGGGGGGGGTGPGGNGSLFDPFPDPAPNKPGPYTPPPVPTVDLPRMSAPGPWSYEAFKDPGKFVAPTGADAENEPGYAFRESEGLKGITNERAAQGLLRSGGTLKDFATWNQNFASNEYGNVYNRRAQEYDRNYSNLFNDWKANRQNSLDAYTTNFGMAKDVYDRNRDAVLGEFAPRLHEYDTQVSVGQHNADTGWQHDFDLWQQKYKMWDDQRRWKYGVADNERNRGLGTY